MNDSTEVERICIERVINGYIIEIKYPEKTKKMIMGNARVMMHLLAGILGYDLEIAKMTPKNTTDLHCFSRRLASPNL